MMEDGFEEVKGLIEEGYTKDLVSMQGLGYKEFFDYFDGEMSLEETVDKVKRDTRRFAKRQLTWFRREKEVVWLNKKEYEQEKNLLDSVLNIIKRKESVMEQRDKILEEYYAQMGIAKPVYDFCMKVEEELKDRFLSIDKTAECNQMKVLRAMQKNHLSEACFAPTTGYGYNDIGRETLEKIYADVFGTEDALVRPQITCGTHALALALMSQLRPGDELLSPVGKPYDTLEEVIGFVRPMALLQNMASVTVR